jgi:hypothetical protein
LALGILGKSRQKALVSLSQTLNRLPFQPGALLRAVSRPVQILLAIAIGLIAAALFAQMEGERGVPPIASGGDFEVRGVKVGGCCGRAPMAAAARRPCPIRRSRRWFRA